jgi:4-hydroxybenzoate polyprenyltransferase
VLLAVLLLLPGGVAPSALCAGFAFLATLCLLLEFRIFDDLADRAFDRRNHPNRITVTAERAEPFVLLALAAGISASILTLVLVAGDHASFVLLAGLQIAALVSCALVRKYVQSRICSEAAVLAKYPFFCYYMAMCLSHHAPRFVALAELYLALCFREVLDYYSRVWLGYSLCAVIFLHLLLSN